MPSDQIVASVVEVRARRVGVASDEGCAGGTRADSALDLEESLRWVCSRLSFSSPPKEAQACPGQISAISGPSRDEV